MKSVSTAVYFCLCAQLSTALPLISPLQLDIQAPPPSLPAGVTDTKSLDGLEQITCDRIMEGAKNLTEVSSMLKGKAAGEPEPSGLEMLLAAIHLFTGMKDTKCITSWKQLTESSAVYVRVTGNVQVAQYEKIEDSPCGMLICDIDGTDNDEDEEADGDDDTAAASAPLAEVQEWGDCTGGKTCAAGLTCNVQNQWYAQCLRSAPVAPAPVAPVAPVPVCENPEFQRRDNCKKQELCIYDSQRGCFTNWDKVAAQQGNPGRGKGGGRRGD